MDDMEEFFAYPLPIPFAHRGGNEVHKENTAEAFRDAYELGYRYFETDVHYTLDGELIAFHDGDMQRTLGIPGDISTLSKAKRLDLGASGVRVPLLEDLLKEYQDVYFHIDAKSKKAVVPLVEAITNQQALQRVCLASFSSHNIASLRRMLPEAQTVASLKEIIKLRYGIRSARKPAVQYRNIAIPPTILYKHNRIPFINESAVRRLHKKNCSVYIWTVNDEQEMHRLLDMGVDGIITDRLRLLKKVLQNRGQWQEPKLLRSLDHRVNP